MVLFFRFQQFVAICNAETEIEMRGRTVEHFPAGFGRPELTSSFPSAGSNVAPARQRARPPAARLHTPGMNCIKIGLPGKVILSKRKGLREVLFS